MFETVTVDEALSRGKKMINYPVIAIMFSICILCYYLDTIDVIPKWVTGIGVFACVALPWLYWSLMITKWRLWAFENVQNVHELKRRAIAEKLIWPDGSMWEKTEIRTSSNKAKLLLLDKKFDIQDGFDED